MKTSSNSSHKCILKTNVVRSSAESYELWIEAEMLGDSEHWRQRGRYALNYIRLNQMLVNNLAQPLICRRLQV